jgi:hypothetical protein
VENDAGKIFLGCIDRKALMNTTQATELRPRVAVTVAVAVSATVFGLGHLGQPQHPAMLATWVLAGLVFGTLYVASGDLALPIGAHAAFNIAHNVLLVRTDVAGTDALSTIARIQVDPTTPLLAVGGIIEAAGFLGVGLLGLLWSRRTRNPSIERPLPGADS